MLKGQLILVLTYRLAAVIESVGDSRSGFTILSKEPSLGDQAPEGIRAAGGLRIAAVIHRRVGVPAAPMEAVRRVLGRVQVELAVGSQSGRVVDRETMSIGRDG